MEFWREKSKTAAFGLEKLAKLAGLHPVFAFYKELSANSAHPSLYSIERYFDRVPGGDWRGFVGGPDTKENVTMARRAVRVALLELELAGCVEYSGDRVALRATADEI